jgi:hypothetical protein
MHSEGEWETTKGYGRRPIKRDSSIVVNAARDTVVRAWLLRIRYGGVT